ncbi:MAG TPA: aminoglycoside phosphotransferase family protein [Mycobacteriales bacterium]|nr:aminoglycoside phosphotransferase family protein [Mycobacteriales bacterium]
MPASDSPQEPDDAASRPPSAAQLRRFAAKHGFECHQVGPLPATGMVNWIYALGETAILRVSNASHPDGVRDALTESVAVPAARAAGIHTPELLVLDDSREVIDGLCTIYERVPGQDLASRIAAGRPIPDRVYHDVGREVAKLHRDVIDVPDPDDRLDTHPRWTGPDAIADLLANPPIDVHVARTVTSLAERMEPILQQASRFRRFLHQDLSFGNIMISQDEFAAIIDWGDAGWADPAQEFAYLPLSVVDPMLRGYREIMPLDGDDTAELRILWDHLGRAVYRLRSTEEPHNPGRRSAGAELIDLIGLLLSGADRRWLGSSM